jgi:hypothetical protein
MKIRWLMAIVALILAAAISVPAAAQGVKASDSNERRSPQQEEVYVDPQLATNLKSRGSARMFIYMKESADLSPAFGMDWEERGWFVYRTLRDLADRSQADIKAQLDSLGADYRSFWIDNVIAVKNTDLNMLNALAKRGDVQALVQEPVGFIPEPENNAETKNQINAVVASVAQINAPDAWSQGYTGQGVSVGIIDSGTRYTHEALVNQYRGNLGGGVFDHNYNWFDDGGSIEPQWPNPHGTHVSGTAVGDDGGANQIGVAPGADWVSCLGCTSTSCPGTNLLACAQFMAAPTDLAGNNPDPSRRVHVVNNSWGDCGQSYDGWYQGSVDAWIAAGVVPVFSNGNASNCGYSAPPGLNTVGNPARYGSVLGIGSTGNADGQYASHSNWGPTDDPNDGTDPTLPDPMGYNDLKPNVVAPGVSICSAYATGDANYTCGFTGTSMSSPAATGVIALMISAAPSLAGDYATLGTLLMETANPVPYDSGEGGEGPGNVPNYATGWGEIDALAAVTAAAALEGPQGDLTGTVTDNNSGLPIAGADVMITNPNPPPPDWSASTDEAGEFALTLSEGTFDVDVSAYGYQAATETGVSIVENQTTDIQVSLVPAATYEVSGVVTDNTTGWPLHAEIEIDGYPNSPIYTDPSDGSYSVTLPEGMAFDFTVTALSGGYDFATRTVGPLTGAQTEDFALDADLVACSAPGYGNTASTVLTESFDATSAPAGWTVEDYDGGGQTWSFDNPGGRANETGGSGNFAIVDSDNYGLGGSQDTGMITPAIDLSGAVNAEVSFNYDFRNIGATAEVDVSTDGGSSWANEWSLSSQTRGPVSASVNLADYAGEASVQLRFRYSDASWDYWWQVDDVEVIEFGTCGPAMGELVTGRVTDANDGSALIGATVSVDGTSQSTVTGTSMDPALGDGAYNLFVPAGSQTITVSETGYEDGTLSDTFVNGTARREDFALNAGRLAAQPQSLSQTVTFGQSDDGYLVLVNDGTAEATVNLSVSHPANQDFEGSFAPAGWQVQNLGGDCVWNRNDTDGRTNYAGGDGFSASADSDVCGSGTTMNTALVSPSFAVTAGSSLDYVVSYRHLGSSYLNVDISTDGGSTWTTLQSYTADESGEGPGTPESLDISAYDGETAQVRFHYESPGWNWWAQVDQIDVANVDWLTLTPDNGTFADGPVTFFETLNVTPTFNAAAPSITTPGTYLATIVVENDTPGGTIEVPVEMIVEPAANQARIAGTISSLGYCDGEPVPLAGANVEIVGGSTTFNVTSGGAGGYELWLDVAEGPLTLTVSAPGHEDRVLSGVPLTSQSTTTRDAELRTSTPCASSSPASLSTTLLPDETDTLSMTLTNDGAGDLNWNEYTFSGNVTLIDQVDNGNDGIVSDRFIGLPNSTGAYSAEDFSVNGEGVVELTADGFTGDGNPGIETFATEIGFYIYPDAGGVPAGHPEDGGGTEAFSYVGAPGDAAITIVDDSLTLDVSAVNGGDPLDLAAGSYWLVAYATVPGTEGDVRWNWYAATSGEGASPQIITPGSAFGGSFPNWTSLPAGVDPVFSSMAMNVQGFLECGASWITGLTPASGAVSGDSSDSIDIGIDSTGLLPGEYQGTVCLQTDDANNDTIVIPVTLTVDAPASFATVEGNVMSLGYCDEDVQPAQGASVTIDGAVSSYNTTTDASGNYSVSIDSAESPVDVSVSYAGHLPSNVTGVALSAGSTSTVDFSLDLDAACAQADPMSMGPVMLPDTQEVESLTMYNYGVQPYDWTLEFDGINNGINGTTDVVAGGGFEEGTPNSSWDEASDAFGTPLCDEASCGLGGGTGPNSGSWWVWFGGVAEAVETGSVTQSVTIPNGPSAELSFFLEIPAADVSGSLEVSLDGNLLFSATEADAASYSTYQQVTVDVSSYADGGTYDLQISGATNSTVAQEVTNFFVDDVSLVVQPAGDCSNPQAIGWASLDTTSGTVAPGGNASVNVTYDSTGLSVGTYEASLCFDTTDPMAGDNGLIIIPVMMDVTQDEVFWDRFEGTTVTGEEDPSRFLRKRPE